MSHSAKWVTEWITPQLGEPTIRKFLKDFSYGNQDFSGGLKDAWQTTSLTISAREQAAFLAKLWKEQLPLSKRTFDLTKKIIFIKPMGKNAELYGKTGTGCLEGHDCMEKPAKMIGWFVGALKADSHIYIFAANGSDQQNERRPAGPRMRQTVQEVLTKLGLVPK